MAEISVIVPVYNCERYLLACLDSLIQQSFDDLEIICVDDGSTDNSYNILQDYAGKDRRIKIYQQKNQGVAAARNTALKYATGTWLAFCDGDDTAPLDAYQQLYKATKGTDVVIGDFYDMDDYGSKYEISTRAKHKNNLFYALFKIPCVWTKLIRKKFVEENKLHFPDVRLGEDVIFLARLTTLKPRYTVISAPVYIHWNHNKEADKSLTHQYDLQHYQGHMYCRDELLRICWEEAKIKEAYYYIYHDMLAFPFEFLFRIQESNEKEQAFRLFKMHLQKYDWSREQKRFECMMGMPYEYFMKMSSKQYFTTTKVLNHSEMVLKEYEAGMLGFRYIIKYIKAWAGYKWNRMKLERKK